MFGAFMPQGWKMELASIDGRGGEVVEGRRDRPARRAARLRLDLGLRPLPQRAPAGPRGGVRVLDDDHRDQPADEPHPPRADGRLQQLPQPRAAGEDHLDGRRHLRRAPRLGHRRRLVRERVPRLRLRVPEAEGPHRHAARDGRDRQEPVDRRRRRRTRASTTSCRGPTADPKPLQDPHPPVWIGGGGEQLTLRVVARHADCSNFGGSPEQWAHKRDVLRAHCADVGRDPAAIRMTWSPEVFIRSHGGRGRGRRHAQPVGRAGRELAGRQPRRHAGAGRREDPDLRRPRLPRASSRGAPTTPTPRPWSASPPRSSPTSADARIRRSAADREFAAERCRSVTATPDRPA